MKEESWIDLYRNYSPDDFRKMADEMEERGVKFLHFIVDRLRDEGGWISDEETLICYAKYGEEK